MYMRLEFKDVNKEINIETQAIGTEDINHVLQVLKLLLHEVKPKVVVKPPTVKRVEVPTRTP